MMSLLVEYGNKNYYFILHIHLFVCLCLSVCTQGSYDTHVDFNVRALRHCDGKYLRKVS